MRYSPLLALAFISLLTLSATPAHARPRSETKFGIRYSLWHCDATSPVYDLTEALAGRGKYGPPPSFHWWGKPALGYYCLSKDDKVLAEHARQLAAAGVDFIFIDMTNWQYKSSGGLDSQVLAPYENLLKVWSGIDGAPKVVPWVPVMPDYKGYSGSYTKVLAVMNKYAKMGFSFADYDGKVKPLFFVDDAGTDDDVDYAADKPSNWARPSDPALLEELHSSYTLRLVWTSLGGNVQGLPADKNPGPKFGAVVPKTDELRDDRRCTCDSKDCICLGRWSYLEACRKSPRMPAVTSEHDDGAFASFDTDRFGQSRAAGACNQARSTGAEGEAEATPVTVSYRWANASDTGSNVQKFGGRTLARQFDAVFNAPPAVALIEGWNEWIVQRFCEGDKCSYPDQYVEPYNRDIEPSAEGARDYYYRLLLHCLESYRSGAKSCEADTVYQIRGVVDGVSSTPDGARVSGWACAQGFDGPVGVHVYVGGPAGSGKFLVAAAADRASDSAVAQACGASGKAYRFDIPLTPNADTEGKALYVHGISPFGLDNKLIDRSGEHVVPKHDQRETAPTPALVQVPDEKTDANATPVAPTPQPETVAATPASERARLTALMYCALGLKPFCPEERADSFASASDHGGARPSSRAFYRGFPQAALARMAQRRIDGTSVAQACVVENLVETCKDATARCVDTEDCAEWLDRELRGSAHVNRR